MPSTNEGPAMTLLMRSTVLALFPLALVAGALAPAEEPRELPDQYATALLQVDGMI
jgi:hypothetical protein